MTDTRPKPREKMRVSSDMYDKGYRVDHYRFEAWLDGNPLPRCITADEDTGTAIVAALDEKGCIARAPVSEEVITHTLYGRVEIRKTDGDKS